MGTGPTKLVVVTTVKTTNSQYAATTRDDELPARKHDQGDGQHVHEAEGRDHDQDREHHAREHAQGPEHHVHEGHDHDQGPEPLVHEADQEIGHSKANCKLVKY